MRIIRRCFLLLLLICALPLIGLATSTSLAEMAGCEFNENAVQPCVAMGLDMGNVLAAMVLFGWTSPISIPALALVGIVWIAIELIALAWRTRRGDPATGSAADQKQETPETVGQSSERRS